MECGVSTANFYPEYLLTAFEQLVAAKVPVTEVFINTFSEMEEDFLEQLLRAKEGSGMRVVSVHPFSAVMEGFFFASDYKTRFADGAEVYRKFFRACQVLGAGMLVFHGDHAFNEARFSMDKYVANFRALAEIGREYDVTLCHENVSYCRLGNPDAVRRFRALAGDDAAFVLDVKQVRRGGGDLEDMLDAMSGAIRNVHISDYTDTDFSLLPGRGCLDYTALAERLLAMGYEGDMLIELYRDNFGPPGELFGAMHEVGAQLACVQGGCGHLAPLRRMAAGGPA